MAVKHPAKRGRAGAHHVSNRLKRYASEKKGFKKGSASYNQYVYGGLTNVAKKRGTKPGRRKRGR